MKAVLVAAALAASVSGAAIEARQRGRPTRGPDAGPPDVAACGLDAFVGHTSEALLYCSALLQGGTYTTTTTYTARDTTTTRVTVITTLYPPSTSKRPSSTPPPVTSKPTPTPTSTPKPSTTPAPPSKTSTPVTSAPAPSGSASCGLVGYTKDTAAYYFDSSGTKNTFAACSAACKADAKCQSFGYGEANCMLFDIPSVNNVNYNPMSPYTFYDASCPKELPVKKRQVDVTIPGGPARQSSACSCLITSGKPDATRTATTTVTSNRITRTETVTRTVSLLPGSP